MSPSLEVIALNWQVGGFPSITVSTSHMTPQLAYQQDNVGVDASAQFWVKFLRVVKF